VSAQLNAELLKVRSTRTTVGLALGMLTLILLFSLLSGLLPKPAELNGASDQRSLLTIGSVADVFSALAGVMLITSEYRYGTIRPTFLFTPRRSRVLATKVATGLLVGLAFGAVGEALGFGVGYAALAGRGIDVALDFRQVALMLVGTACGVALWGALGVGIGAVVPSQVGAIVGLLTWRFIVENLFFAFIPSLGRFAPLHAQDALAGLTTEHLLSATGGGLILVAWATAFALVGTALVARRDVS
jgi:ABC-2 type transport system permease protein